MAQWEQTAPGALTAWRQTGQSGQAALTQMGSWQQPVQRGQTGMRQMGSWGQSPQNRQTASWGQSAQNGQGAGQMQWRQNGNWGQTAQNGQAAVWAPRAQQSGSVMDLSSGQSSKAHKMRHDDYAKIFRRWENNPYADAQPFYNPYPAGRRSGTGYLYDFLYKMKQKYPNFDPENPYGAAYDNRGHFPPQYPNEAEVVPIRGQLMVLPEKPHRMDNFDEVNGDRYEQRENQKPEPYYELPQRPMRGIGRTGQYSPLPPEADRKEVPLPLLQKHQLAQRMAQQRMAQQRVAQQGMAQQSKAQQIMAQESMAQQSMAHRYEHRPDALRQQIQEKEKVHVEEQAKEDASMEEARAQLKKMQELAPDSVLSDLRGSWDRQTHHNDVFEPTYTPQEVKQVQIPHEDDFGAPIRWVKVDSNDTSDGLAKVTDPMTGQNKQFEVNGTVYVPITDYNPKRVIYGLRQGAMPELATHTTANSNIPKTSFNPIRTMLKSVRVENLEKKDWLAFEVALGASGDPESCSEESCQARCRGNTCDTECRGDTCGAGCIGKVCAAIVSLVKFA
ncbi:uncharacterized protein LOC113233540 [Hyposmocoma kahamanoa]|uniref:uncharacterized protein LOC113233540 n=1 Tax=Hyposmocoma kahamanoa TaxID=1477025 RepID=UPI000E6D6575|nr:uncharacterized protein LOC113233540 [Hyposmocoma kahamanoa]